VLFGVRSVNATESHRGLMLAVASESVVKLVAALLVGGAITFFAFGSFDGIAAAIRLNPEFAPLLHLDPTDMTWWANCLLSALAFLCLPRQFHVAVIENTDPRDVRTAAWVFPLYLVGINLFVLPVAIAGLTLFPGGTVQADTFMVVVPRELGWTWLAFAAFLGGLSAATGMIVVATLALGTMVSNDIIWPLLARHAGFRRRWEANPGPALLASRRVAVVGIMALGWLCYQALGEAFPLAAIGLISFAAVAQFAPALLGGLYWRRATAAGAIAGVVAGFLGWTWTVAVPAFATAGWIPPDLVAQGPFGLGWLSPQALFGVALEPAANGVLWSLGPNLALFVAVSLATMPSDIERRQADRFVGPTRDAARREPMPRATSLADLHELAARYVGCERADATFARLVATRTGADPAQLRARGDAEAVQATERLLAGAIGTASARVVVASLLSDRRFSRSDARELIDEASRAILTRHELMRDALQNIRQGLCAFDEDGQVTLWNRRFLELLDLPAELVRVGTGLEDIVRYNEGRGEYGGGQFDTLLARRSAPERRERADVYERRRPDGTVLEVSTNPIPSGGFVVVYTDVTDRELAARALREANEALEARVGERTLALSAAKAEAERANLGKTRFLAAAGHDLMQPLQAARLFVSALGERVSDPALDHIDASLDSVEHLLGELVEVSKLDGGATTPSFADFRIADLLRPLCEEVAALARADDLGFRMVSCSASVRSDPALLRRIVQNFLTNALRYTARGRILVGCRQRGREVAIEVWDTGPGIPPERMRDIFVEFHRLEHGKARGEGLGLGLSIVERLAGLMGHHVEVRSRPGHGSCFAVRVPLAAAPVAAPASSTRAGTSFNGALVVFVDNEAEVAAAMTDLLTGWSCTVVAAATPDAALAELGGRKPDILLSDYHLDGGRTGLEAIALLRARLGGGLPAALITADRDPALRAAAEAAGLRLLHKPIRPGGLRALLAQMLAEHWAAADG